MSKLLVFCGEIHLSLHRLLQRYFSEPPKMDEVNYETRRTCVCGTYLCTEGRDANYKESSL